jgi:hypothetical protein
VNINPKLIFALTKQPADNSHKFYFSLPHTTRARTHKQQTKRTEEEEEEEKQRAAAALRGGSSCRRCSFISLSLQRVSAFIIKERRKNTKNTLTHASEQK